MDNKMTDPVYIRFSNHIEYIQALLEKDETFKEIWADYEEISTWLACHDCQEGQPSKEYDGARELKKGLEEEIQQALKDAGF